MDNPWCLISEDSKILEIDAPYIDRHNNKFRDLPERCISTIDYPEPFVGSPLADIFILLANPGRNIYNEQSIVERIKNENLSSLFLNNLRHIGNEDFPFYYLNSVLDWHPGYEWWNNALKGLVQLSSPELLAKKICSVELYGYHSVQCEKAFLKNKNSLKSSDYSYYMVSKAIAEEKIILLPRAVGEWFKKVPALKDYDNCFIVAGNRGIEFSENTISPIAMKKIKQLLI